MKDLRKENNAVERECVCKRKRKREVSERERCECEREKNTDKNVWRTKMQKQITVNQKERNYFLNEDLCEREGSPSPPTIGKSD